MATIKDIARIAGVNVSTVSRALSGMNGVGDATREKLMKIARELGYSPDFSARALVGKSTKLIGVIVPEISSNYYSQIVEQIENGLDSYGYSIIIETSAFDEQKEVRCIEMLIGRKVDGIIFAGITSDAGLEYIEKKIGKTDIPVVFLEPVKEIGDHDCIIIDGEDGVKKAIGHFANSGHKSIGFIGEDLSSRFRLPVFKKALKEFGIPCNDKHIKSGKERLGGYLRMKELLDMGDIPTAVFAAYDYIAIGAMRALQEAGLKVPEDISIIGYDNIRESEYLAVPLTTVYPPITEMAAKGVEMLLKRIESSDGGACERAVLYSQLIVRESASAANQDRWLDRDGISKKTDK